MTASLFTLGLNHQTAPLAVRERVVFHVERLHEALAELKRSLAQEAAILSTCNRTELYVAAERPAELAQWLAGYHRLGQGDDLETALVSLGQVLDGFYTLVVTTQDSMAVVRDPIACKPAIIAETADYVAMASEFRALAELPGIEDARIFEPEPGTVYTWKL